MEPHLPPLMRSLLIRAGDSQDPYIFQALESWEKSSLMSPSERLDQLAHESVYVRAAAVREILWWGVDHQEYFERIFKSSYSTLYKKYGNLLTADTWDVVQRS